MRIIGEMHRRRDVTDQSGFQCRFDSRPDRLDSGGVEIVPRPSPFDRTVSIRGLVKRIDLSDQIENL